MKKVLDVLKWIGLFIWQLPQNIVALVMLPFMGSIKLLYTKRCAWCIVCQSLLWQGSISLGNFVLLGNYRETTAAHELGHVSDSHWMGPLYLLIIGLPSLIWATFWRGGNYYSFYTEKRANKNSFLHENKSTTGNYYYLEFDEGRSLDDIV